LAPRCSSPPWVGLNASPGPTASDASPGQFVQSANAACQIDPDLARVYYVQMVERGAHHNKALCVVAAHLADRAWVTLMRQEPYLLRDLDGNAICVAEGKTIVAEHFTLSEDVRRRRRTKKQRSGKAPQVLDARSGPVSRRDDKRGDLPLRPASSSAPASSRRTLVITRQTRGE